MTDRPCRPTRRDVSPARLAIAALAAALLLAPALPAVAQETVSDADVAAGRSSTRIILKLRAGLEPAFQTQRWTVRATQPDGPALGGGPDAATVDAFAAALQRRRTQAVSALFHALPDDQALVSRHGLDRYYLVHVPEGTATDAMAAELALLEDIVEVAEVDGVGAVADTMPDDLHPYQYGLLNLGQTVAGQSGVAGADIGAPAAWDLTTGAEDLVLAVIDAGTSEHVDLAGRLVPGWAFDGGSTDGLCGSHGTHVAGIAAANTDNGQGIAGANWGIRVMPIRVLNGCTGLESDVAAGVLEAIALGADVINMSLQYYTGTQVFHDAVTAAYEAGIPILAATGNNQANGVVAYPARWPETMAVAATDNQDERAPFSNNGPEVDFAAPGDDIYSLTNLTSYGFKDGTSMATPFVSGVVGLMLSLDPTLTVEEIRAILCQTADDVEGPGWDTLTGCGRIDAAAALLEVQSGLPVPGDVDGDGAVTVSDLVAVLFAWGACGEPCPEDLDGNGVVDVADLIVVIFNWS